MKKNKMPGIILLGLLLIPVMVLGISRLIIEFNIKNNISSIENSKPAKVAIVLGAGLRRDGTPTAVLQDRVAAAARLYKSGKVEKILMSGDNRFVTYNEPASMREYAIKLGVPSEDIVLDYAGRRTYDTCYRAKHIFMVNDAIIVTQNFHLPRALYMCKMLEIKAQGVPADLREYTRTSVFFWQVRETVASFGALLDIWILKPVPVMGKQEPIFPNES